MQPRPDERLAGRGLALGDLVLVVREDQVDAAGVDVERLARGASCSSPSTRCASPAGPRRSRCPTTARRASGPSTARSRGRRPCAYSSASTRSPTRSCSGIEPGQPAVGRPRGDPEEDRAVVGPVGVAPSSERRDQVDDLVDVLGRPRQDVGRGHPQRAPRRRGTRSSQRSASSPIVDARGARARMILSSMSVMFITHVTAQPAAAQVADEQVGEQERSEVADVGRAVDRRAAAVDPDVPGLERLERSGLARQRVVEADASSDAAARRRRRRRVRREIAAAGALGAGEVAGRRLDVDRGRRRRRASPAIGAAHRVEADAEPRPGGDDRQVDRGADASPRRPVARRPSSSSSLLAMPRGRRGSGREQPPEVAEAGRAEQRVGDRVERDVAVGVAVEARRAGDRDAAEDQRRCPARTGGCPGRCPTRIAAPAAARSAASTRARSAGSVTLRLVGFAGDRMDGNATGLEQGGLVGPGLAARSAGSARTPLAGASRRTPCGVWAAASPARSTVSRDRRRRRPA